MNAVLLGEQEWRIRKPKQFAPGKDSHCILCPSMHPLKTNKQKQTVPARSFLSVKKSPTPDTSAIDR